MKKKFFLIILCVVSIFACILGLGACGSNNGNDNDSVNNTEQNGNNDNSESYEPTEGLQYIDKGSSYEVKNLGTATDTEIFIAKTYNGKPVTSIGKSAFSFKDIKSVTIPDSIKIINNWAFSNSGLTSITIPDSVTYIEYGAFDHCESLKSVTIGKGVTSVGANVFLHCNSLNKVTINSGLKSIGTAMFQDCTGLKSIIIPNSVTSIEVLAFSGCSSLTSIKIPNSVKYIGTSAFYGCNNLTVYYEGAEQEWNEIVIDNGNDDLINALRHYNSTGNENGDIGNEDNSKPDYQAHTLTYELNYDGASNVSQQIVKGDNANLITPERTGYKFLGWYYYGSKIESGVWQYDSDITLTARWEAINYSITYNTDGGILPDNSLKTFSVSSHNLPYTLPVPTKPGLNFAGWYINSDFSGEPITVISKNSLQNYVLYAKYTDEQLLEFELSFDETYYSVIGYKGKPQFITVPETKDGLPVKEIAAKAFENCNTLKNIILSENINKIGNYAFYSCGDLTSITIPDGITTIGNSAFYNCTALTSITLPVGVTSIDDYAFYSCGNLTSITIPDGVTSIGVRAFYRCSSLTSIILPDSVTRIGEGTFYYCSNLTSITIPDGVTDIGEFSFRYCSSLISIILPDSVTSIGDAAFQYCRNLTSVTISDSLTSIGSGMFYGCESLTSITIPDGVTSVASSAFPENLCNRYSGCYYLPTKSSGYGFLYKVITTDITNVKIHTDSKTINSSAFRGCTGLTSIVVGESNMSFASQDGILYNKAKTQFIHIPKAIKGAVTIPNGVTSIGNYAFDECSGLTNITIPDGVTSIGNYAFTYCSSLTNVTIPDGVKSIGEHAFAYCSSLTSITLPDSVTSIGDYAFYECDKLTRVYYKGTTEDWGNITIEGFYNGLTSETLYYYSETEPQLNEDGTAYNGNYWHYGLNGEIVVWIKEN